MLLIVDCAVLYIILKWYWIWVQHNLNVAVTWRAVPKCKFQQGNQGEWYPSTRCSKEIKGSVPKMNGWWYMEAPYAILEPMVAIAFSGCDRTPNSMMEGDDWLHFPTSVLAHRLNTIIMKRLFTIRFSFAVSLFYFNLFNCKAFLFKVC